MRRWNGWGDETDETAVGAGSRRFLEGLIGPGEVLSVEVGDPAADAQPDDTLVVRLARRFDPSVVAERHFVATASCGICGKASIDEVEVRCAPIPAGPVVAAATIVGGRTVFVNPAVAGAERFQG